MRTKATTCIGVSMTIMAMSMSSATANTSNIMTTLGFVFHRPITNKLLFGSKKVERHALLNRQRRTIHQWQLFLQEDNDVFGENSARLTFAEEETPENSHLDSNVDDESDDSAPWLLESEEGENSENSMQEPLEIINGTTDGFVVTKTYHVPMDGFQEVDDAITSNDEVVNLPSISDIFSSNDQMRLRLEYKNVTLPAALMLLDPDTYPTQSRARKAIRQRSICVCRYNASESESGLQFNELGKVIARVYPGDVFGFQRRAGSDYYAVQGTPYRLPSFDVPVVFEDDYMAIVNKPPGIVVYRADGGRGGGKRSNGQGRDTLLSALPSVLKPPTLSNGWGVYGADGLLIDDDDDEIPQNVPLKRPQPVHRLDRPTSGVLVVAKTKAAVTHLCQQFEFRKAKKTYMAIVNGDPEKSISQCDDELSNNDNDASTGSFWHTIDYELEGKSAITKWRVVRKIKSLFGNDGQLTLVELKPQTGRYHQLRRHMAWVCKSPLVGDTTYDEADDDAMRLRKRGLFLCSNEIIVEHPYYNTPDGQIEWNNMKKNGEFKGKEFLEEDEETGRVLVWGRISLPDKFESFLTHEENRAIKFAVE